MDCTTQIRPWFYTVLALIGLILFLVAMFMNYNLRLDARTVKLEKKNGKEMKRIEQIEKQNDQKDEKINQLQEQVQDLESKIKLFKREKNQ